MQPLDDLFDQQIQRIQERLKRGFAQEDPRRVKRGPYWRPVLPPEEYEKQDRR